MHTVLIECNEHTIKAQNSVKYLGLYLDNLLIDETVVNNNVQNVNARLKFLYRICSFLDEKFKEINMFSSTHSMPQTMLVHLGTLI